MSNKFDRTVFVLIIGMVFACAVRALASGCPEPDKKLQDACKAISYDELPQGAKKLLEQHGCTEKSGSYYDYGSEIDLNDDGLPEYQFCCTDKGKVLCHEAVFMSQTGNVWKIIESGIGGYRGANGCLNLSILEQIHHGYHDICHQYGINGYIKQFKDGEYKNIERTEQ
jgi:hypothetical protein